MSGLDQPIVIANSCYHVGHERSVRVAEDQGFFKEEGLEPYLIDRGGLVPAEWEHEALGRQMWERGVDIATAVTVRAAIAQRARGEDVYIVGGWRIQLATKLIGAKGITRPEQLRGGRSITREKGGMLHAGILAALRTFGVGPRDVEWMEGTRDPATEQRGADLLRSGEVTFLSVVGGPEADRLISEGYPVVLDVEEFFKSIGPWPPGSVIVATKQTIEDRGEALRAFLRANLRAYWFVEDPRNHAYMFDLENRMRQATLNHYERHVVRMLDAPTPTPRAHRTGYRAWGEMVLDGLVQPPALAPVIDAMVKSGELEHPVKVDDVLKDAASIDAYEQLVSRGLLDLPTIARWRGALGVTSVI